MMAGDLPSSKQAVRTQRSSVNLPFTHLPPFHNSTLLVTYMSFILTGSHYMILPYVLCERILNTWKSATPCYFYNKGGMAAVQRNKIGDNNK